MYHGRFPPLPMVPTLTASLRHIQFSAVAMHTFYFKEVYAGSDLKNNKACQGSLRTECIFTPPLFLCQQVLYLLFQEGGHV